VNDAGKLRIRPVCVEDGARIFHLIDRVGELERNTCYAYLLLCTHFAETCFVAERADSVVGFVLAYCPPTLPQDVFVWQVGVSPDARGIGVGRQLLTTLLAAPACLRARYLTATVSPDNTASLALFHGFARREGLPCVAQPGYASQLFAAPHPDETLLRIGPMKGRS
jgi:L-2,4-diaminobutyric acid acetyltransferase